MRDLGKGDHLGSATRDLELRELLAERSPGHRRIEVEDVASPPVGGHLKQIASCSVSSGKRDQRAPQVMEAASVVAMGLEVALEVAPRLGLVQHLERRRQQNQVIGFGVPADEGDPAGKFPGREHGREGRVDRNFTAAAGLCDLRVGVSDEEPAEGLGFRVDVAPPEACNLTNA